MNSLRKWLDAGDFSLCLSPGFFGFYAHAGVVAALSEAGYKPRHYAGASSGALIAASIASGLPMSDLKATLFELRREQFWDPRFGLGLLKGQMFRTLLRRLLPIHHIEDCPTPLSISAYDPLKRRTVSFKEGPLAEIISASCAVPLMFHPVRISGRYYVDGGLQDPTGLVNVPPEERTLCHQLGQLRFRVQRPQLHVLQINGLPQLSPFHLQDGPRAFGIAYQQTREQLR